MKLNRTFKFLTLSCSMLLLQSVTVIPTANAEEQGVLIRLAAIGSTNTPLVVQKEHPLMVASNCTAMCDAQKKLCYSQCGGNSKCEEACWDVHKACTEGCN